MDVIFHETEPFYRESKPSLQGENESEEIVLPVPDVSVRNESEKGDHHDVSGNRRDQDEKEQGLTMAGRLDKPDLKKY